MVIRKCSQTQQSSCVYPSVHSCIFLYIIFGSNCNLTMLVKRWSSLLVI